MGSPTETKVSHNREGEEGRAEGRIAVETTAETMEDIIFRIPKPDAFDRFGTTTTKPERKLTSEASSNAEGKNLFLAYRKGCERQCARQEWMDAVDVGVSVCYAFNGKVLIRKGAKSKLRRSEGWTVLVIACPFDQSSMAELIISKGAQVNLERLDEWIALMFACRYDQPSTA